MLGRAATMTRDTKRHQGHRDTHTQRHQGHTHRDRLSGTDRQTQQGHTHRDIRDTHIERQTDCQGHTDTAGAHTQTVRDTQTHIRDTQRLSQPGCSVPATGDAFTQGHAQGLFPWHCRTLGFPCRHRMGVITPREGQAVASLFS